MAERSLRLVVCERSDQWNAIALTVTGGSGYHEWSFLDLQERLSGLRFVRLLVVDGTEPVGIIPIARRSARSWRTPTVPFPFLGPVVPPELLPAAMAALRRWQWRHGLVLHRFDLSPRMTEESGCSESGSTMTAQQDGTVLIDLAGRDAAELDARMSRLRRRSMVKAERAGGSARRASPGEVDASLGPVLSAAYGRRQQPSPYPASVGRLVEQWAEGRDDVYLGSAFVGDTLVGSIVVLGWHPVALAWIGGVLPEFHETRVGDLMHRELIHWAAERGNLVLDMSGRVDDAIERYKLSLGGEVAHYTTITSSLVPRGTFSVARGLRRHARTLRGRVPRVGRAARVGSRALVDIGFIGLALMASVSLACHDLTGTWGFIPAA